MSVAKDLPVREPDSNFVSDLRRVLRQNIRDYGMFIALFVIWGIFYFLTDGIFLSARNLSNLLNQFGYIAVLGIGVTLVIVIRHIDLSIGFLAGFLGAAAAIAMTFWGLPVWVVVPSILIIGALLGLLPGYMVAQLGIPAFVATLAGFLVYRGAILVATEGSGTIIISDRAFNAIGNGFIPDISEGGLHIITLVLGILAIVLFIYNELKGRRTKLAYEFEVLPMNIFILKLVFMAIMIGALTWVLASYNGLSWTVVVLLIVLAIYHFITTQTVLGRHIYAVGGNPEAAELSGVNVKRITYLIFSQMGMLAALSGMLFASRLQSATTTAGTLFELDAIAASYVGGVSAAGGVGRVTGAVVGALVMASLTSGMNLMGIGISYQYIVRGIVLALAVIFDVATRNR
ncbi:sugar ABC transporter permease [Promineifilum sp.]|uniref:sugar ABC transporter permease n=1 Tax=Promineifilum sp. TaxID=2664178 RepID=UPI0035ADEDAF